jgi:beta-glucosidase-like glycosyl hydrolase/CubicO group peptidase (beta-lactamase class C family)
MIMRKLLHFILFLLLANQSIAQKSAAWADSVLKTLTEDEKIAQLIMVRLSGIDAKTKVVSFYDTTVERDIKKYNIGGICIFQGAPVKQASLINHFQSIAKTPIMIAVDGETGVGMRLDSVASLPRMMMLGALQDKSLVYKYGEWVADQCKQMGIQVNFAPVADINNNPNNPVINDRSFGENKYRVADMAIQYMLGMKSKGVMGSAKHFPGHGDVDVDSHFALPIINKSREQLDSLELYTFRKLIDAGVGSAMVAHLFIPSIDSTPNRASSISPAIVTKLLKNELGFKGLTFTDGLEMKGVAAVYPDGAAGVESLIAGNDMLCLPGEVPVVIAKVKAAIEEKRISWEEINMHAKKVLEAKYDQGLSNLMPSNLDELTKRLNEQSNELRRRITEKAITLAKYEDNESLPLKEDKSGKYALLEVGKNKNTVFSSEIRKAYNADVFIFDNTMNDYQADSLLKILQKNYEKIIVALHELPRYPANNFLIGASTVKLVNALSTEKSTNLIVFGNPYAAKSFSSLKNIFICYDDEMITQQVAAKMVRGEIPPEGKLPVSISQGMDEGAGYSFMGQATLTENKFTQKENFSLGVVDSIANDAIRQKATPGISLLVLKDGKIMLQKSYGHLSYDSIEKVNTESVYDMASVTKICATTLSVMKLFDEKKIELDKTLGDYIPWVRGSNKEKLVIKEILLHQAGLKAFIPFYKEVADSITNKALPAYFSKKQSSNYGIKIDDSLYMRTDWKDTMYSRILTSNLAKKNEYIYSDNDFIFLGEVVKAVSGQPLEFYVWNNFYRPLGFRSSGFNPTNFISKKNIVPTEQDPYFRERLIRGSVHDPGAAMFGGVAGHAGLFSNAYEIAVLMQMIMNEGIINEKRFISASTIDLFTAYQSEISRRGLGFDKPEKDNKTRKIPYPAINVSPKTFGHTGFTGTCAWADPESKLVFVLLANRVHPVAKNLFGDLNVRGKVMEEAFGLLK